MRSARIASLKLAAASVVCEGFSLNTLDSGFDTTPWRRVERFRTGAEQQLSWVSDLPGNLPRLEGHASRWLMGYECAYTFFCTNAQASRLRAGLGSLLLSEVSPARATLGDGSVVAFKRAWEAARSSFDRFALVPLSDRNIREDWFFLFEEGSNPHGSPAFDHAPSWHQGAPFEWFAVAASCQELADAEHTAVTLRPYFKDLANIMSQDIVRRFYRRMAFAHGALLALFTDDYSDMLFSADVLLARDMLPCSFDESDPEQLDAFVGRALRALQLARAW